MAPEEWIESFKDRIVMMHFHDNDGQDDLHQPCGEGVVGYDVVFDACKSAELSCPITLEVRGRGVGRVGRAPEAARLRRSATFRTRQRGQGLAKDHRARS